MLMTGGARALDRARGRLFGAVGRWPAAQALARRRGARLCVVGCASVAAAFAGVALVPLVMLAVAPVLLGVPHVAADLRYLVVRRAIIARRAWLPLAVAAHDVHGRGGARRRAARRRQRPRRRRLAAALADGRRGVARSSPAARASCSSRRCCRRAPPR